MALAGCASTPSASAAPDAATDGGDHDAGLLDQAQPEANAPPAPLPLVVFPAEFTEESMPMRLLHSGDQLNLWKAPQGGHVVLIGAQVENLASNTATLRVRMRRPGGIIVAEEARTVAMVPVPGAPGRMQPDIRSRSQVAHVPLCPDYDADDIVDQPLDVDIEVTALYTDPPVSGKATLRLVPACTAVDEQDRSLCRCECAGRYVLGRCAPDAAPADGG